MSALKKAGIARRTWDYFRDPAVALWRKAGGLAAAVYVLSPIDFVPDVIPVLGWLDDLGVVGAAAWLMIRQINRHAEQRASRREQARERPDPQA